MALSEREQRLLTEIEQHLNEVDPGPLRRIRHFLAAHYVAILLAAATVLAVVLLGLVGNAWIAAPVCAVCGALAGFMTCRSRYRAWRHR